VKELKGILPAIVTPFDSAGEVDLAAMHAIITHQLSAGVHGFYLTGGTGEGLLLSQHERQTLLDAALDQVNGRGLVIAHVGAFQTAETLALARHACRAGADAIAALPPSYFFKPDADGLVRYYSALADVATVPILVYNLPQRTGITMTEDLFERLLAVPGIVGMKDSSGNIYALGLFFSGGRKPVIFEGEDTVLLYGLLAGACGGIGATYNIMPHLFVRLWNAFQAGDIATASKTQLRINEIVKALLVVDLFGGVKQTMAWMGLPCGEPRTPNRPLNSDESARLRRSLDAAGFFGEVQE
jgi:N-acetylneuraminate lyase